MRVRERHTERETERETGKERENELKGYRDRQIQRWPDKQSIPYDKCVSAVVFKWG